MILGFAEGGGAVLLVSSEFEELQALATRLCVMRDGRIVAEVPPDADYRRLVALATGTHEELHLEAGVSVDGA
jgi:ABC-type sugar transport system ATPase subunit